MAMNDECADALFPEVTISIRQKMERSAMNKLWAMSNMAKLRSKYADKYVALDEGSVLAFGDSPDDVFRELRKKRIKDISTITMEFVPKRSHTWLH
jgi:ABC-type hemin transport system substrate-binding protein